MWFCSGKPNFALLIPLSSRSLKLGCKVKWVPRRGGKQTRRDSKLVKVQVPRGGGKIKNIYPCKYVTKFLQLKTNSACEAILIYSNKGVQVIRFVPDTDLVGYPDNNLLDTGDPAKY